MLTRSWVPPSFLSLLLLLNVFASADPHDGDEGLSRFISRPDIKAPKWNIHVNVKSQISPGHWFVAPFELLDQRDPANGWVGPHIYDSDGELVWSGASVVNNWGTIDFKKSNVKGEEMLTFLVHHAGEGYILDNSFRIREKIDLGVLGEGFNSHEFNFIENGTRAMIIHETRRDATKEQAMAIKWEKNCKTLFNGFKELDTSTWKPVHEWSSFGHIGLEESTFLTGGPEGFCNYQWGWDYIHFNSVDKDHNGDYYISARHTDTIYKISKSDGHVMWKLQGLRGEAGDFAMRNLTFSRQHNVRFHGFNGTHEIISILDNAHGQDEQAPSYTMSRALILALQTTTEPRTASIVSSIEHPDGNGSYAPRRGNYQIMPDANVFIGWSERGTHSEHTPDGKLVMEASLAPEWLGTYRSYKFPFTGRPIDPPVAVSTAYPSRNRNTTITMVHVSWNGATDVESWNLYKTTETGKPTIPILARNKTGFETALAWEGFASYIFVEAIDKDGQILGRTDIIKTTPPTADAMDGAVADEVYWLQEIHGENDPWIFQDPYLTRHRVASNSVVGFLVGALCSVCLFALGWFLKTRGYFEGGAKVSGGRYERLSDHMLDQERGDAESHVKRESGNFRDRDR